MIAGDLVRVPNDIFNLLPEFLLDVHIVNEAEDDNAECSRGRVEPREEEEDSRAQYTELKIFLWNKHVLPFLVKLINEDVNDVVSPVSTFPL